MLDIVPNHMAVDDANRYWTEQREKFFDVDAETGLYRRFFDIDDLAGVRQEDEEVFEETHRLALPLVREGVVDGLRIDHPDGLADPEGYLQRLRDAGVEHVWVEKILDPGEALRARGRSRARSATSSSTTPRRCSSTRPARRGSPRSGTSSPATTARSAAYADEAKLEQARGDLLRRGRPPPPPRPARRPA